MTTVHGSIAKKLEGTGGDDELIGTGGDDKLRGKGGNDHLSGRGGKDQLQGDDGSDVLKGESKSDHLNGGHGDDKLIGGDGKDVYVFGKDFGKDVIKEFDAEHEKMDITATGLKFFDLDMKQHGDLVIDTDQGTIIIDKLVGDLEQSDFLF